MEVSSQRAKDHRNLSSKKEVWQYEIKTVFDEGTIATEL